MRMCHEEELYWDWSPPRKSVYLVLARPTPEWQRQQQLKRFSWEQFRKLYRLANPHRRTKDG